MSTGYTEGDPAGAGRPASEEELRAAYEAEIKRIRVEQVLLEHVVTLVNLGMRRTGLAPGTEDERDLGQVRLAIEAIRLQLPLLEQSASAQAGPIRDALSQLQLAFVKLGGAPEPAAGSESAGGAAGGAGAGGAPSHSPPAGAPGEPPPAGTPGEPSPAQPPPPDAGPGAPGPEPAAPKPGEPGPAQRSGKLWVPGQ
jgi:hypothetical protein